MTAHEIHALSGAYAVDALDDLERARFEAHLAVCAECRAEVASLQTAGAAMATLTEVEPPAAMRDRILADIKTVRPLPPVVARLEARRPRRLRGFVAAAAVLATVGGGIAVWQNGTPASQSQLSATDQVIRAADVKLVSQDLKNGASVTVYRSAAKNAAVLVTRKFPDAPSGKVYELWFRKDNKLVAAGLMTGGGDRTVRFQGPVDGASAVGVTVEPTGGSEQPTTVPVAWMNFEHTT